MSRTYRLVVTSQFALSIVALLYLGRGFGRMLASPKSLAAIAVVILLGTLLGVRAAGLYWTSASLFYWCVALYLIGHFSPIFIDGSGPMASFYWGGNAPGPTMSEYYANQ